MIPIKPLNPGIVRIHRIFFVAYVGFAVLMAVVGVMNTVNGGDAGFLGFVGIFSLPIAALHWYAAKGAKLGRPSGKIASRVIATLMILGFPIGTAIGTYLFYKTSRYQWQSADQLREPVAS